MREKIQKIIDKIRPYIQMHGGDVFLIGIRGGTVTLKVTGSCSHCSLKNLTYNNMLGSILRQEIPEIKKIIIKS